MTTVKVKFRASTIQGKEGRIVYKVTHKREAKFISSDFKVYPSEWNDKESAIIADSAAPERMKYLREIESQIKQGVTRLNLIVGALEKKGTPYSSGDVVRVYNGDTPDGYVEYARQYIAKLEADRVPKATNYKAALRSFSQFNNGRDIPIKEITGKVIKDFETWLLDKGLVRNSTSAYMRNLHAIYNHAKKELHLEIAGEIRLQMSISK